MACARRVKFVRELLKNVGIDEDRVQMHYVSAAEAEKLKEIIEKVAADVKKMGLNPIKK
ncbi:MAG: hydrogenase iron-sulfur subunit [Candidatus Lokiarchaeota archaeon]|nr:hydrogenase iron-sulfur subunit [Candidatus Lokiarchaeota archaeon]